MRLRGALRLAFFNHYSLQCVFDENKDACLPPAVAASDPEADIIVERLTHADGRTADE